MKKFVTICISLSLALAATVLAQKDKDHKKEKKNQENAQHGAQQAHPARQAHPMAQPRVAHPNVRTRAAKRMKEPVTATHNANPNAAAKEHMNANAREKATQFKKERNAAVTNHPNREARKMAAHTKKLDIKAIKQQHAHFRAKARPQQVPAVTFNQNHRINGSEHWEGQKYAAFRSYHPERHDQHWYRSHYNRIELIGGGYYYWDGGYWYPAWGYNPSVSYYVYDGPIYTGSVAEPPDQIIADVQAALQDQGYYEGEVDGLLGPLTRQALTDYQSNNGLYTTGAIDEPTLDSLGMG